MAKIYFSEGELKVSDLVKDFAGKVGGVVIVKDYDSYYNDIVVVSLDIYSVYVDGNYVGHFSMEHNYGEYGLYYADNAVFDHIEKLVDYLDEEVLDLFIEARSKVKK